MFASKQAPFLITETNAGAIGGPSVNFPAYDGQWRQAAWAFVARGAEMIEYWHWHTNHFGTETYWIGILPHDQQPGRVYGELARLGRDFQVAGSAVVGLTPDARVGLLYSARAKWGLAFQSSFPLAHRGRSVRRREHGPAVVPHDLRGLLPRHVRRPGCRPGCCTTSTWSPRTGRR